MSKQWRHFWNGYRNEAAQSEDDLFIQVGKTIARQPIARETFHAMVQRIILSLQIGPDDHVLDLCCGNGLVSFELASCARHVSGVDFAEHLISAAQAFKSRPNIRYRVGDVTSPLTDWIDSQADMPNKLLMNDALAYFEPDTLAVIMTNVSNALKGGAFRMLLTGIPNEALKWSFYDTPERKLRYEANLQAGDRTNDGLGRWWAASEIEEIATALGLCVRVEDQPSDISNYRMDALIWRD